MGEDDGHEKVTAKREMPPVPPGDTVIRYPNGSFIVVKCEENVARELFETKELGYHLANQMHYRLIYFPGTVLLMLGTVFLTNATLPLQIGWALAYALINAAHWVVAALSPQRLWDFSAYDLHEIGLARVTAGLSDQATIALLSATGERAKARCVEAKRTKAVGEADAKTTPDNQGQTAGAKEGDGQTVSGDSVSAGRG